MSQDRFEAMQKRFDFVQRNFHQLCRFCTGTKNLQEIFVDIVSADGEIERTYSERNVGTLLDKQYIPFDPEDEFDMPNFICDECVECLVSWNRFRRTYTSTTKLLIKVRGDLTIKSEPENDEGDGQQETILDENNMCEVEYAQNTPENMPEENVTIIETIQIIPDGDDPQSIEVEYLVDPHHTGSNQIRNKKRKTVKPLINQRTANKTQMKEECSSHQSRKSNKCPICDVLVNGKMKDHMMRHNDPDGRPFKCTECDKAYSFRRTLADHIRQVHQRVRYPCDVCEKHFISRDVLRIHKKLHTNEEHPCELCGQVFQQKMYLKKHMVMHDAKKFVCEECGKSFRFRELMKQHMRIHTGEKPFHCESCPKSFRTSTHLKQHYRTHTQEKVFKCKHCIAAYANKRSLERHVASEHLSVEIEIKETFSE